MQFWFKEYLKLFQNGFKIGSTNRCIVCSENTSICGGKIEKLYLVRPLDIVKGTLKISYTKCHTNFSARTVTVGKGRMQGKGLSDMTVTYSILSCGQK